VVSAVVLIWAAERRTVTPITPLGEAIAPSEGRKRQMVGPQSPPRAGADHLRRSER
jgi:hypothetical protein